MPCPTCGKDDHARSSSSKCLNRKRRIRETDLDSDQKVSVYNVKKGLTSILCPLSDCKEAIVCTIRDDVREMSRLSIELSYLVNFFYKHYSTRHTTVPFPAKFDALQFTYALKGCKYKIDDPDNVISTYMSLRKNNNKLYDGRLRTFTIMQIAKQYSTILETNIQTHAFKRLKRYMYHKFGTDMDKSVVHSSTYDAYYNGMCKSDGIGEWFTYNKINCNEMKKNFWKFIPLFLKIQHELYENKKPSFNVFPIYSHGLKFITYDSRCIHELLRRVDPTNTPSQWSVFSENTVMYWNRHFTLPRKFGYSFSTDGVSVCLSMNRIVQKDQKSKSKKVKSLAVVDKGNDTKLNYSNVIAVDPGAKTPIVTCTRNGDDFSYKVLKKERVMYESKECHRVRKRLRFIKDIEERIRMDRESVEKETGFEVTRKSKNADIYTTFQLKWFDEKQKIYEQRRLQRLKFDKYINDQKMLNKIVDEYFGKEPDTLVVYGAGFDFMNKGTFKGHRKFRHNEILKILKQRKNLSVFVINEAFTTKNCSYCHDRDRAHRKLNVSKSPHRYVHCSVCRKGIHRDKNGAKNILLKYEKNKLPIRLSSVGTDMNFTSGGSS